MDKVTRQVGQHVEFDPEWETAFNLVIKIQSIIASILDWCSNDVSRRAWEYLRFDRKISSRKNYYSVLMKLLLLH